jgi:hypothetical protein
MTRQLALGTLVCMMVSLVNTAQAANCSNRNMMSLYNQAISLKRPMDRCNAIVNKRSPNLAQFCRVCGPTFVRLQSLERNLRKNKACFVGNRPLIRAINELSSVRYEMQFVRRGCGY